MSMTLQSSIKDKILVAQEEASDESTGLKKVLDKMIERRTDKALYYRDQIWAPLKGNVRTLIMDKPIGKGCNRQSHQAYQQPEILECKWERIAMDFVTKLPRTSSWHDTI
ncbi:hypothetical protein Tco_1165645 [Tanacetum coccineum]